LPDSSDRAAAMPFRLTPDGPRTYTVKIVDSDDGSIGYRPTPSPGAAFGSSTLAARGLTALFGALMKRGTLSRPAAELRWERAFFAFLGNELVGFLILGLRRMRESALTARPLALRWRFCWGVSSHGP